MNTNQLLSLSVAKLKRMATLKGRIERMEARLAKLAGDASAPSPLRAARGARKRRKMGAAARRRISQAQKARWAKYHARKGK
jgi:hypothetical protein